MVRIDYGYELLALGLFAVYVMLMIPSIVYGLMQIHLIYAYLKAKKKVRRGLCLKSQPLTDFPFITVQLPVYNEKYVTERLIDAVARFEYPREQFEIQVLDDSTDETVGIVDRKVKEWQTRGIQIAQIRRNIRTGFKAGALQEGMQQAKGEFIAIFDADFVPSSDFLLQTMPAFENARIGMVQTRWDHLNKRFSMLTHMQAFLLDAHFSIEQLARNHSGCFMNFSGTGGVWRRSCIEDAGGWHSDTLTEDFDLSYRAQLKGWKFKYLEHIGSPAELPPVMSALKAQQYRWVKGIVETAKKHIPNIVRSDIPVLAKAHALLHLLIGTIFVCAFTSALLSVPLLFLKNQITYLEHIFQYTSVSLFSLMCLTSFHYISTMHKETSSKDNSVLYFARTFPLYLSFFMGISLHNSLAAAEGLLGIKTSFIRTPKFNVTDAEGRVLQKNTYQAIKLSKLTFVEAFFVLYFLGGAVLGIVLNDFSLFPYHLMLAFGFGLICYYTWMEVKGNRKPFFQRSLLRHKPVWVNLGWLNNIRK